MAGPDRMSVHCSGSLATDLSAESVEALICRVLQSPTFSNAPVLSRFLRYLIVHAMPLNADQLKEYSIGVEVFGRGVSFDPRTDTIVRVQARRLRAKLEEYYRDEGRLDSILIELPKGHYIVDFRYASVQPAALMLHLPPAASTPQHTDGITPGIKSLEPSPPPLESWVAHLVHPKTAALTALALLLAGVTVYRFALAHQRVRPRTTEPASIVVMPFVDLSPEKDQQYFCDGIAEELTNALMHAEGLRVIGPQSAFQLRDKANDFRLVKEKLNVTHAVRGSVRKSENRIKITAQLISLSDGSLLWSETYDRHLKDVLAMQTGISRAVVEALSPKLTGERTDRHHEHRKVNPEVYEMYLWGRHFWNERNETGIRHGIEYFEKAISADPNFAQAYSGLADSYVMAAVHGVLPRAEAIPKAKAAALKALMLDDTLAEAHASLGCIKHYYEWDWAAAEGQYKRSISLNPNYVFAHQWYSEFLVVRGRTDEAIAEAERARALDPLSLATRTSSGYVLNRARRYDDGIAQFQRAEELDPNSAVAHLGLGWAYLEKGMYADAIRELRQRREDSRGLGYLGSAYARSGRRAEALNVIARLRALSRRKDFSPYDIARIYADLKDRKLAFKWLERACANCEFAPGELGWSPSFDSLRTDPRYLALMRKIGLERD